MKNVDQNSTHTFQTVMIWYFLLLLSPEFSKDKVAKVKLGCGLGSMVRNSLGLAFLMYKHTAFKLKTEVALF